MRLLNLMRSQLICLHWTACRPQTSRHSPCNRLFASRQKSLTASGGTSRSGFVVLSSLHKIDDRCLAPLSDLKLLEVLQLPEAMITDKGLVHLEGLVHLRVLNLYGTKVTDSGLKYLRRMSKLKSLDLRNTRVTE